MTVKSTPKLTDIQSFHPRTQDRILSVVRFIEERRSRPTHIEDVMKGLEIGYGASWQGLDRAWNCGLITKVIVGKGCYWIPLSSRGYVINKNE